MTQPQASPYEKTSHSLGAHTFTQEGPILFFASSGPINLGENQIMFAHMERVKREYGAVYLLIDGRKEAYQEPAARAWAARNVNEKNMPTAVVMFGASFTVRVAVNLFNRAVEIFTRIRVPLTQFSTEAEAREFLLGLAQTSKTADGSKRSRQPV